MSQAKFKEILEELFDRGDGPITASQVGEIDRQYEKITNRYSLSLVSAFAEAVNGYHIIMRIKENVYNKIDNSKYYKEQEEDRKLLMDLTTEARKDMFQAFTSQR
jgi:hypothetical protein